MPEPIRNLDDLKRELTALQPGQQLALFYVPFESVFSGSCEGDEVARDAARKLAGDYNCTIDEYPELRAVAFRKL